jgi:uncharacterized protein (TIGR02611 family)
MDTTDAMTSSGAARGALNASHRRLTRSNRERRIAGVAGGLGAYFDIDPVAVRVAFVGLAFAGGVGIALYLACWLLIPEEGLDVSHAESVVAAARQSYEEGSFDSAVRQTRRVTILLVGSTLIIVGLLLLPLPGPFTLPLVFLGLTVLSWEFGWAQQALVNLKAKVRQIMDARRSRKAT